MALHLDILFRSYILFATAREEEGGKAAAPGDHDLEKAERKRLRKEEKHAKRHRNKEKKEKKEKKERKKSES